MSEQSESPAASVIIREEARSIERIVALKFPFSVATVTVDKPLPGGPDRVGTLTGTGFGVANAGRGVGVGVGEGGDMEIIMGVGDGVGGGLKRFRKKAKMYATICIDIC